MIKLQPYQNAYSTALTELWNLSMPHNRWNARLTNDEMQKYIITKPIFNPNELILAFDRNILCGFIHYGPDIELKSYDSSTIYMCVVHPDYRRQCIATQLLNYALRDLWKKGCSRIIAMPSWPNMVFYAEICGPTSGSGVLEDNEAGIAWLKSNGFEPMSKQHNCCYARRTSGIYEELSTPEIQLIREKISLECIDYGTQDGPQPHRTIWYNVPLIALRLRLKSTGEKVAECMVWYNPSKQARPEGSMGAFGSVGVRRKYRRQGFGTYMCLEACLVLADHGIDIVEASTDNNNLPARRLYEKIGFQHVTNGISNWQRWLKVRNFTTEVRNFVIKRGTHYSMQLSGRSRYIVKRLVSKLWNM